MAVSSGSQSDNEFSDAPTSSHGQKLGRGRGDKAHTKRGSAALSGKGRRRLAENEAKRNVMLPETERSEYAMKDDMTSASSSTLGASSMSVGKGSSLNFSSSNNHGGLFKDKGKSIQRKKDEDAMRREREFGVGGALKISKEASSLLGKQQ